MVAEILDRGTTDLDNASRVLAYELRRWHVGLVLWSEVASDGDARLTELQHTAVTLSEALGGSARPLIIASGAATLWVWAGIAEEPGTRVLDAAIDAARGDDIAIAVGSPGYGVEGFRQTHRSALLTRRVMRLATRRRRPAQTFRTLSFTSLLSADLDQMRAFVADELGALATDDDATSRLRATLLLYFDDRSSASKTARRLGVHTNTINYRIRRCGELIGHPVHERRAEIEAALILKQHLAPEAFEPDGPTS
jgi:DNA-binding PucR family transcriptional regulator